ncbi:MAG: monovalent cation/H(+) antiporter subunit G [Chloroflexota bacterium]
MDTLTLREIIGLIGIGFGLFFYVVGVLGLTRFPDVYMRIHSAGKVSVLGIFGFIIGGSVLMPEITLRVIALGIFMFVTQPVASHSVAQAAYRSGVKMYKPVRDDLEGNIAVRLTDDHHDEVPT